MRQLLRHRQKLVEWRTQVKNQLQHLALNQGVQRKRKLWSKEGRAVLEQLPLQGWTARRRAELLGMLDRLEEQIKELDTAVRAEAERRPEVRLKTLVRRKKLRYWMLREQRPYVPPSVACGCVQRAEESSAFFECGGVRKHR